MAVLIAAVFPDAEDDAGGEQTEEGIKDDGRPSGEVAIEPAEDGSAVDHGKSGFTAVAERARDTEGSEELAGGDAEGSGSEQEGKQRDGRWEQSSDTDAEDAVMADPTLDPGAKARRHVAVEHGLAAFLPGLPGEPAAQEAAGDGAGSEEPGRFAVSAEDEDENVGAAWDGKRDGRRVKKSDGKDAGESEMKDPGGDELPTGVACCLQGREVHAR